MSVRDRIDSIFPSRLEVPESFALGEPSLQREWLSDGELREWNGPTQDVFSPICERRDERLIPVFLGHYPRLTGREALDALRAAEEAYGGGRGAWPTMPIGRRIEHVEDFAFRMKERRAEVVRYISWEISKPLCEAEKEFDRTVAYILDTIDALKSLDRASSRFVIEQGIAAQIRRAPLGVTLCMGPYNYPLNETFATLIPALIMGNTVLFKPPRLGVLLHRPLLKALRDSFPPGVVNTLYGDGAEVIGPLMSSGRINALAFIGTSRVADTLRRQHPKPHRLRCILGMEAKNAGIVLESADLDVAVRECIRGSLCFNGQRCTALKILFVHERISAEFVSRFVAAAEKLPFGLPWEAGVKITPLPELRHAEAMAAFVSDAVEKGASVVNEHGGLTNGTFFFPAVLYPVGTGMRIYNEEQFGPVVPVVPFRDVETPVSYIQDSNFGQQVSVFGSDPDAIAGLIDPLVNQVCRVNVNSQCQRGPDSFPFTGRKDSAEGTLSVSDALKVFSVRTLVAAATDKTNKRLLDSIVRGRKSGFLSTDFIF